MKYRLLLGLLLAGALFAGLPASAANYTYTIIDDTRSDVVALAGPVINDSGDVAYWAGTAEEQIAILRGDGTATETVVTTGGSSPYTSISSQIDMSNSGEVVFMGYRTVGDEPWARLGLYSSSGTTFFDERDWLSPNRPSLDGSALAYLAGGVGRVGGIFIEFLGQGGSDQPSLTTELDSELAYFTDPDINFEAVPNNPNALAFSVVFYGTYRNGDGTGPSGIISYSNGSLTSIAETGSRFISFHPLPANDGDVAYIGYLEDRKQEVYKNQTLIASTDNGYSDFQSVAISNGKVAFLARIGGGWGIFTGPDPVADKVIATGDTLLGETVRSVELTREGINSQGQIAFRATLASGVEVIARANPASAPAVVEDVTQRVKVKAGGFQYSARKKQYSQKVTVKNVSKQPITGPVSLVLDNLSPVATLVNSSGTTAQSAPTGSPYLDLNVGADGVLRAGETAKGTLRFKKLQKKGKIKYNPRVLAGTGTR